MKTKCVETDLQRGKMGLCQIISGCDGPFLLPCGLKSNNEKYCEEWKKVSLTRGDIIGSGNDIRISPESFKCIKEKFLARLEEKQ